MKADEGKTPWQYRTVIFLYFGTAGIISTFYYMFLQREVGLNLGMIGRVTAFGAVFSLASQPALGCLFSGTRKKKRFIRLYFLGLMAVLGAMTVVTERTVFLFAVLYGCLAIPMIGTYEILVGVKYIKPLYLVCFLGMGSYVGSDFAFSPYLTQLCENAETAGCYSVISMLMFGLSNLVFPPLLSAAAEKAGFGIMYLSDCALAAAAFMIGACFLPDRDRNRGGDKFV